mgnify:CR=1 FL=1
MEAKWGLIPDMSATVTLRELVPRDVALELTLTGRVFDAAEAVAPEPTHTPINTDTTHQYRHRAHLHLSP